MFAALFLFLALFAPSQELVKPKVTLTQTLSTSETESLIPSTSHFQVSTVTYEDLTYDNSAYLGYLTFGGSSADLPVTFDTTSALVWVFAEDCETCQDLFMQKTEFFTCLSPCTLSTDYASTEVDYQVNGLLSSRNFNITAYTATDTVTMGGLSATSVPIYIVESTTASNYSAYGQVGLGNSQNNLISYFYSEGKISAQIFAFYFSSQYSLLTFGYEEPYFGMEDYVTLKVISGNLAWAVPLTSVQLNGVTNSAYVGETETAQFDSTLHGLGTPRTVFEALYTEFATTLGAGTYGDSTGLSFACVNESDVANFPKIGFTFGSSDRSFVLDPSQYVSYSNGQCIARVFTDDYLETWVLGLPFLKAFYVVFDMDDQELKIATLNTEESESYTQSEGLRWTVIVVGVLVAVISVVLLLLIFKPVPVGSAPEKAD